MTIRDATPDDLQLDPVRRSKFSFQDMAGIVTRQDNDEPLVGTEALLDAGFLVAPFWETPGDTEGVCYASYVAEHPGFELSVREGVFSRLKDASRQLPRNWQIVLKAGFRPYEVQVAVLDAFIHASHMRHPNWSDARHLMQARTFVADPTLVCPPHVTGGAVDIDVKDKRTGEYIDMGCPPNTDSDISYLHSDLVTPEQHENRMILLRVMLAAGFAPNPHEWWHYQYGETYWAAFYGHQTTLYDLIKV